jgi:predicted Zn-dependent protease with MMP-like domain
MERLASLVELPENILESHNEIISYEIGDRPNDVVMDELAREKGIIGVDTYFHIDRGSYREGIGKVYYDVMYFKAKS